MKKQLKAVAVGVLLLLGGVVNAKNVNGDSVSDVTTQGQVEGKGFNLESVLDFSLLAKSGGFERGLVVKGNGTERGLAAKGNGTERGLVAKGNGIERGLVAKGDKTGNG
ncbi:hypothetical protein [Runella zeae]|uniref:hypothetical protein n=1 Tax=Runella zeae TaxID=94255 RepID=UPI000409E0BD|nr:hypothetical protein [Runella zeae]